MKRYVHEKFRQVPVETRRAAVDEILAGRKRQIDVANELGLRRQTVHAWVTRARSGHPPASRGRPATPELDEQQHTALMRDLREQIPADFGFGTLKKWNWHSVMQHVSRAYGLRIYRSYAIRLLQEASPQSRDSKRSHNMRSRGPLTQAELADLRRRISATQKSLRARGIDVGTDGLPVRQPKGSA